MKRTAMNLRDTAISMLAATGLIAATDALANDAQYAGSGSAARALFLADDLLDWGQLGPPCPNVGQLCIPNGSVATSNKGIAITILSPSGGFNRADEGTIAWSGHFQAGEHLIYSGNSPGIVTFTLQRPVAGIGFHLGADGPAPSVTIQIFDSMHRLISSLTQPPSIGPCSPSCNDATFVGFYDHAGHISSVSIIPNERAGFAVNQFSLIDQPRLTFAGMPRQINCYDQSIATLTNQYGDIAGAAAALGFTSVPVLQNLIIRYCNG
jgi:hypothetical protein